MRKLLLITTLLSGILISTAQAATPPAPSKVFTSWEAAVSRSIVRYNYVARCSFSYPFDTCKMYYRPMGILAGMATLRVVDSCHYYQDAGFMTRVGSGGKYVKSRRTFNVCS